MNGWASCIMHHGRFSLPEWPTRIWICRVAVVITDIKGHRRARIRAGSNARPPIAIPHANKGGALTDGNLACLLVAVVGRGLERVPCRGVPGRPVHGGITRKSWLHAYDTQSGRSGIDAIMLCIARPCFSHRRQPLGAKRTTRRIQDLAPGGRRLSTIGSSARSLQPKP